MRSFHLRRFLMASCSFLLVLLAVGLGMYATSGRVHANDTVIVQPQTCANQPDSENCDGQDPYEQHCVQDAKTIQGESIPAFFQEQQIGVAELRYSSICDSYWDRVIAYAGAPVSAVSVLQSTLYTNSTTQPDGSLQVYTNMVYHHRNTVDTATFEVMPNSQLVTAILP